MFLFYLWPIFLCFIFILLFQNIFLCCLYFLCEDSCTFCSPLEQSARRILQDNSRVMLLLPILSNLVPEKIIQETLHDHHTSISIGGRPICNLSFTNIDSYGWQQWWTSRPHQQPHRQSNCIIMDWKSAPKRARSSPTAQTTSSPVVRGGDQFSVPGSSPVQGWYLLSRNQHEDCLSNGH